MISRDNNYRTEYYAEEPVTWLLLTGTLGADKGETIVIRLDDIHRFVSSGEKTKIYYQDGNGTTVQENILTILEQLNIIKKGLL